MKKNVQKLISVVLAICMILPMALTASAATYSQLTVEITDTSLNNPQTNNKKVTLESGLLSSNAKLVTEVFMIIGAEMMNHGEANEKKVAHGGHANNILATACTSDSCGLYCIWTNELDVWYDGGLEADGQGGAKNAYLAGEKAWSDWVKDNVDDAPIFEEGATNGDLKELLRSLDSKISKLTVDKTYTMTSFGGRYVFAVTRTEKVVSGGGGSAPSEPSSSTTTTTNPDGSVTTTTTNKDGSVTQTTTKTETTADGTTVDTEIKTEISKDGSQTTTETKTETSADGSKTETTTKTEVSTDGSQTTTETKTETNKDGNVTTTETKTETAADGSKQEIVSGDNGVTATTPTDKNGNEGTTTVVIPSQSVTDDEPITLPVGGKTELEVDIPDSVGEVKVEIPVEDLTPGTVVVIVHPDGTEEVIKNTNLSEDGVVIELDKDTTVKVVDKSKNFIDMPGHWAENAVDYVAARGLFAGTGVGDTFSPEVPMTRGMLAQVIYNLEGAEKHSYVHGFTDIPAGQWYTAAVNWAAREDVVAGYGDGSYKPNKILSREEFAQILYNYAKALGYDVNKTADLSTFNDGDEVSWWATAAMQWAVSTGLMSGKGGNILGATHTATRAEGAQLFMNFMEKIINN